MSLYTVTDLAINKLKKAPSLCRKCRNKMFACNYTAVPLFKFQEVTKSANGDIIITLNCGL